MDARSAIERIPVGVQVYALAIATLALSAMDHWTTYVCLRRPVAGWDVMEANPISDWLFQAVGLVPGLLVDSLVTVAAVAFLLATSRVPNFVKKGFFGVVVLSTGYAVINNYRAMEALGISPLGIG
jgi:uncharacterized protein YacL